MDYVECYPEGYRRGVKIAKACADANIDGFPTWIIKGEVKLSPLWQVKWNNYFNIKKIWSSFERAIVFYFIDKYYNWEYTPTQWMSLRDCV